MGPERQSTPVHDLREVDRRAGRAFEARMVLRLPGEWTMTRFQRVLLFSAGCGVVAIGIAYLIVAVVR